MEALNAVGLTPLSVLSDRRTEHRKSLAFHTNSQLKNCSNLPNFSTNSSSLATGISRSLHGGLVLLSSVLGTGLAKALSYEEALQQLQQSVETPIPEFDASSALDSVTNFVVENPLVVGGGFTILAVPLVLSQLFSKPKPWGVESAKAAYAKLADDASAQLLDVRPLAELRQVGSPDIRSLKKKPVTVPYKGEDKPGFLKKLSLKFKEPEKTTLVVLDKFDGNSELVAELVTANGFKAAYAIKDGAEGSRGWMNSGLPWILPKKLSLDLSNLTAAFDGVVGEGADTASLAVGLAAAAGLGLLAFSEVETILQFLGSAALIQFVSKKFLFAEDRKQTLQEVDELLTTKVAPKELVDDIKQIGKALLPPVTGKALPAPKEASLDSIVQKVESVPEANDVPPKVEAAAEPTPEINSVPKAEVQTESLTGIPRSLSPYPNYPDLKPPTSPMPSQP